MTPWTVLGTARIPNSRKEMTLSQRNKEFSIRLKGAHGELMNSRVYSSEWALAELGCAHIQSKKNSQVLVGGLGMGFTLSAALKTTSASARVIVAELIPEVIEWNQGPLGECAGKPLNDNRVRIHLGDVAALFMTKQATYDAVLLDVDNGPEGFTQTENDGLYSLKSLHAIRRTLHPGGMLAIWSAWHDPQFTLQLKKARFKVEIHTVRAHQGKGSRHTLYLARKH